MKGSVSRMGALGHALHAPVFGKAFAVWGEEQGIDMVEQ